MTTLIICRHGNTFAPGQTPTRVGKHTDIPLVDSGLRQAEALGMYLPEKDLVPNLVFASHLKRSYGMAERALEVMDARCEIERRALFDEIDYGPDENKVEDEVIARIGQDAIDRWNREAVPPPGWKVDPAAIEQGWMEFADEMADNYPEKTVLVITSNGVGRFAPYITGDYESFRRDYNIKLKTGALGIFEYDGQNWQVMEWGVRPPVP